MKDSVVIFDTYMKEYHVVCNFEALPQFLSFPFYHHLNPFLNPFFLLPGCGRLEFGPWDGLGEEDGSGDEFGSGDGSGEEFGSGDGSGEEFGSGDGSGEEFGSGDGSGEEFGSGDGCGEEFGSGEELGSGDGSGEEFGPGDGSGEEFGSGEGSGDEFGSGDGSGDGSMVDIPVGGTGVWKVEAGLGPGISVLSVGGGGAIVVESQVTLSLSLVFGSRKQKKSSLVSPIFIYMQPSIQEAAIIAAASGFIVSGMSTRK